MWLKKTDNVNSKKRKRVQEHKISPGLSLEDDTRPRVKWVAVVMLRVRVGVRVRVWLRHFFIIFRGVTVRLIGGRSLITLLRLPYSPKVREAQIIFSG